MPAPASQQFLEALKISYKNQGFVKKVVSSESGDLVPSQPLELTPEGLKQCQAISDAMASVWKTWQAAQAVSIPTTSSAGSPSAGILP